MVQIHFGFSEFWASGVSNVAEKLHEENLWEMIFETSGLFGTSGLDFSSGLRLFLTLRDFDTSALGTSALRTLRD
jgi:hypothetical protein